MMPKEKALEVLAKVPGLEEKLPDMIARVLEKLKAEGAISTEVGISKEAGLGDFLGKPILLALAVVMLSTGYVHANDAGGILKEIAKTHQVAPHSVTVPADTMKPVVVTMMSKVMKAPSTTGLSSWLVPKAVFESTLKGAVEDNLKTNAKLKAIVDQQKAGGASSAEIAKMLKDAFNLLMQSPDHKDDAAKVKEYLSDKDISDSATYLNNLVFSTAAHALDSGAVKTA